MAIYTPRGLKIRLPLNYAFALLARLYPRVDAFKVLKTTEGIELIPSFLAFCTAMVCYALQATPLTVGIAVMIGASIGKLLTHLGLFIIPGLVTLSTLYSYLHGFLIYSIAIVAVGYYATGAWGVAAFFTGIFLAFVFSQVLEVIVAKGEFDATGMSLTEAERNFINAYRLHASKIGETVNVEVSDEELDESNWSDVLEDLAVKWPEVVRRFTRD